MSYDEQFTRRMNEQGQGLAQDIFNMAHSERITQSRRQADVLNEIQADWSTGWKLYEAVVWSLQQAGHLIIRRTNEAKDGRADVRAALMLLHTNATLIIQEIGTLLRAGFWGGGAARWRALHELAVTANIIADNDANLSRRYLDHGFVVQTRRLRQAVNEGGRIPISIDELEQREKRAAHMSENHRLADSKYKFHESYAWALPLMKVNRNQERMWPKFNALEEMSGFSDFRYLVNSAHGLVHADSAGVVTATSPHPGVFINGRSPQFISTVARPTMTTAKHLVEATCGGLEHEHNDYSEIMLLQGAAIAHLTSSAEAAFPLSQSTSHLANGSRPSEKQPTKP